MRRRNPEELLEEVSQSDTALLDMIEAARRAKEPTTAKAIVEQAVALAVEPEQEAWLTRKARPKRRVFLPVGDGLKLRTARKEAGLSQEELARRLGVAQYTISKWESSRKLISRTKSIVDRELAIFWDD